MQLHNLKKNTNNKESRQVGRGGKRGKTSGRGTKGQNARSGRKKRPELRDVIKRIPKLRGRGKNSLKSFVQKLVPVNIGDLNASFEKGAEVTLATLLEKGLTRTSSGKTLGVKILGKGEITKAVTIKGLKVSESAKAAIEKAGGKVE
jgi:large subunit ribosomal protein L15